MKVFAYQNPNDKIRFQSSSGGLFTALATKVFDEGGIVYGAAFDDKWKVRHIRVSGADELWRLRGSKYVFSDFTESISLALKDLEEGKSVLYSGTPCQIAAMRKRAGDNGNLLLVEVICHGAPKPEYWTKYLNALCSRERTGISKIKLINFRDKATGWRNYSFHIDFINRRTIKEHHDDNLYMRAFLSNYSIRNACFICPFKYPNGSLADITIGDFWGIENLNEGKMDNDGTSLLIIRTNKGESFVVQCGLDLIRYKYDDAILYNKSIEENATKPTKYNCFQEESMNGDFIACLKRFVRRPFSLRLKRFIINILHN